MNRKRAFGLISVVSVLLAIAGCDEMAGMSKSKVAAASKGLVIILPGIEGESGANHDIRRGLKKGGVDMRIVIHNWGNPIPGLGMLLNQTDVAGNRRAGGRLAQKIAEYQRKYPGRPIFLIGHSGGTGIAIFALEKLRGVGGRPIEGVILLASSVSASHPLGRALAMTNRGILNVYNRQDTAMLKDGTGMFGNVDGGHGPSAGLHGFRSRPPKLYQVAVTARALGVLSGAHFAATNANVIAKYAPAWINSATWPPAGARAR